MVVATGGGGIALGKLQILVNHATAALAAVVAQSNAVVLALVQILLQAIMAHHATAVHAAAEEQ